MKTPRFLLLLLSFSILAGFVRASFSQDLRPEIERATIDVQLRTNAGEYVSDPVRVPISNPAPFLAVALRQQIEGVVPKTRLVSLRGSIDGSLWSKWSEIAASHDSSEEENGPAGVTSPLVLFDPETRFIQFRLVSSGDDPHDESSRVQIVFISPGRTPDAVRQRIRLKSDPLMSTDNQTGRYPKPTIVTRTEWGCPDGQVTTHGTLSYTTVTHLIVHHTATGNAAPNNDWAAIVRSVWNLHVFTNGWADIGYNYLIDPNGVIYEGRAGGDNVMGAHFSGVNAGTMGVSMLGTFTDVVPTNPALINLKKILAWKADQRTLDPVGTSLHTASGLNLKTISGHRDGPGATECPGNALYPLLPEIRTGVAEVLTRRSALASVSAASFKETALAPNSIVAGFGGAMAASTLVAQSSPLPLSLAGTQVIVRDSKSAEKPAPLFFVSPGQVNFLLPAGLANGEGTVFVTNADGFVSSGSVSIATIAPSLFAANANGRDVASAVLLRIRADGTQLYEPVASFDSVQRKFVPLPIDLGLATDNVFLVAYGTGIRGRSALSAVSAKIGGLASEVLFADAAEGFFGLDQLNLRIPRSLSGRGEVDLELLVDGQVANLLKLVFK
jgi:uncharacterized protein (TIGR03437 family)